MPDPLTALLVGLLIMAATAFLLWPQSGLYARWRRAGRLNARVLSEDALKHIHKSEIQDQPATLASIAGTLNISLNAAADLLHRMQTNHLVTLKNGAIYLTPEGRDGALHVIRAHRLWESYLANATGYAEHEWHGQAEELEHALTPAAADALALRLGNPSHDPHGDPIPTINGRFVEHSGQALTGLAIDQPARIVHLEDEPEMVYAQLAAEGLHPGQIVRVTESTPQRIRFWTNGNEHVLAPMVAANVSVVPLAPELEEKETVGCERLSCLEVGETAVVVRISKACRGAERRRFMDLGILPGTPITAEMRSPSGDPTAYRIRGALIALRAPQANLIKVKRTDAAP
jgi:DtxR family transcriptional regulator, Mn-dependent transcriptional regulator